VKTGTILDKLPSVIDIPKVEPIRQPEAPETPEVKTVEEKAPEEAKTAAPEAPAKAPASGNRQESTAVGPSPVKFEVSEADWENWKRLGDPFTQESLLSEWRRRATPLGLLEKEFRDWANSQFANTPYEKLPVEKKAELMWEYLYEVKGLLSFYRVPGKDGPELYFSFGDNDVLFELATNKKNTPKWVGILLTAFFGENSPRLIHAFTLTAGACSVAVSPERIDPPDKLRLRDGVLDLETLSVRSAGEGGREYFTYYSPLFLNKPMNIGGKALIERIKDIKEGSYDVERNKVYQLFRNHFDKKNWEYFTLGMGAILSPYRHRLINWLIGPPGSGKSTLLRILRKPIAPVVGCVRMHVLLTYPFGPEPLIGKMVYMSAEKGEVVLKHLDMLNQLFGESDEMDVPRKYKPFGRLQSLKTAVIAMNDPPLISEYGGETMRAFLDRLNIISIAAPEGFTPIPGLAEKVSPEDAFEFLIWCRVQLEKKNWKPEKLSPEEILDLLRKATNTAYQYLTTSPDLARDPRLKIKGTELYDDLYCKWCEERGITPISRGYFYSIAAKLFERIPPEKSPDRTVWFRGVGRAEKVEKTKKEEAEKQAMLYELERYQQ
jgi:energy-coupling factor transporter ATP-binding protein EcfA2